MEGWVKPISARQASCCRTDLPEVYPRLKQVHFACYECDCQTSDDRRPAVVVGKELLLPVYYVDMDFHAGRTVVSDDGYTVWESSRALDPLETSVPSRHPGRCQYHGSELAKTGRRAQVRLVSSPATFADFERLGMAPDSSYTPHVTVLRLATHRKHLSYQASGLHRDIFRHLEKAGTMPLVYLGWQYATMENLDLIRNRPLLRCLDLTMQSWYSSDNRSKLLDIMSSLCEGHHPAMETLDLYLGCHLDDLDVALAMRMHKRLVVALPSLSRVYLTVKIPSHDVVSWEPQLPACVLALFGIQCSVIVTAQRVEKSDSQWHILAEQPCHDLNLSLSNGQADFCRKQIEDFEAAEPGWRRVEADAEVYGQERAE